MLDPVQLRLEIVRPVLQSIGMWSYASENLVVGTAIQESTYMDGSKTMLKQMGKGPALGICQMEPDTHDWLINDWLMHRPALLVKIHEWSVSMSAGEMTWNMAYAVAMCRVRYYTDAQPLPAADDLMGLANYWKRVYNTVEGKGRPMEFITKYQRFGSHNV